MKYFQHSLASREDDRVWELIDRHGLSGYGIWWVILEELYKAEDTGFTIEATETWVKRLSKSLNLSDYRSIPRFLDTLAELGLIDQQMWAEHVLYSQEVVKGGDAYIQKKAQNAERKRRERERSKQDVTRDTSVTFANVTHVTLSEAESYSYSDQDQDQDRSKTCAFANAECTSEDSEAEEQPKQPASENHSLPVNEKGRSLNEAEDTGRSEDSAALPRAKRTQKPKPVLTKEGFTTFWDGHPRKISKQKSYEVWQKIQDATEEEIISALVRQVDAYQKKNGTDYRFFPHPLTWLRNRRWEDGADGEQIKLTIVNPEFDEIVAARQRELDEANAAQQAALIAEMQGRAVS